MKKARLLHAMILASLALAGPVLADEFKLKSGETLQGTVVSRDDKAVVVDHAILGRITIPVAQLAPAPAPAAAGAPATVQAAPAAPAAPAPAAAAPAAPVVAAEPSFIDGWKAKFEAGGSGQTGNSESFEFRIAFGATKETASDRWKFDTAFTQGSQNGVENRQDYTAGILKDWLFEDTKFFWWADARYDWDTFKSWDHRVAAHTGPGYEFLNDNKFVLRGRIGVGASKEWGSDQDDIIPEGFGNLDFTWKIAAKHTLNATTTIYPSFNHGGEFRARNTLDWTIKLDEAEGLALKLGLIHEYESEAVAPREKNDLKYLAALVFEF